LAKSESVKPAGGVSAHRPGKERAPLERNIIGVDVRLVGGGARTGGGATCRAALVVFLIRRRVAAASEKLEVLDHQLDLAALVALPILPLIDRQTARQEQLLALVGVLSQDFPAFAEAVEVEEQHVLAILPLRRPVFAIAGD